MIENKKNGKCQSDSINEKDTCWLNQEKRAVYTTVRPIVSDL